MIKGAEKPVVAIAGCLCYEYGAVRDAITKVFEQCGGISGMVRPGQKVLIKPNLLAAAAPAESVTTHPLVVRVLIELIQEAGGTACVGDNPGNDDQLDALKVSGMQAVIEQTGAEILLFEGNRDHHLSGFRQRTVQLACELDQVDLIINAAKLKTHSLTGLTAAVKNNYGCLVGSRKKRYHMEHPLPLDFSRLLVDICLTAKPAFSLIDAVVAMEGPGPRRGKPRQLGLIIGSINPFALDSVAADITGFLPHQVPTIAAARELKLPGSYLADIEIRGVKLEAARTTDFDRGPGGHGKISRLIAHFPLAYIRNLLYARRPYPQVEAKLCSGCGVCAVNCPLQVIDCSNGGIPEFDLYECIRCYCCQEHCAQGAIKLSD